jgi:predicted transcriptional regulator
MRRRSASTSASPCPITATTSMAEAIKQRAHELIEALPDDATWQDLVYALELRGDVEAGLADAKAGRVTDSEDLRREYGRRR